MAMVKFEFHPPIEVTSVYGGRVRMADMNVSRDEALALADALRAAATGRPTQEELRAAFDSVLRPGQHWKGTIDIYVPISADQKLIREAVIHFTGSIPKFTQVSAKSLHVEAAGYYAAIGA